MAQTLVFTESILGPYIETPPTTGELTLSWTTADPVNGNYFNFDTPAGDIFLVWNTAYTTPATVTITSTLDTPFLRLGDITYTVPAGQIMVFNFSKVTGWGTLISGASQIVFTCSTASCLISIIQR